VPPFAADGASRAAYWLGPGAFGFSILKKAGADRIQDVLRILSFLASPFGSQEYTLTHYGIQGVHTRRGQSRTHFHGPARRQFLVELDRRTAADPVPRKDPHSSRPTMQGDEKAMLPAGVADPSVPLYSPTNRSKGGSLNQALIDGITDIVAGRRPLSDFNQLVTDWRNAGGDQIRHEFEQALA
jgi:putative aldouronate transport system substrate-binding protein